MIEKIMKLASLMLMLGEVSQLPEGYKKKYLEASKELEMILEENYNAADVAENSKSNASAEVRSSLTTDDEIEAQVQNLMARFKLAQHFQMAETINKDNEIFNKFGFIDYLRGKISDKENNTSVEKQKEELRELIGAVENYIKENSINAKKNRFKEMLAKLKSTLEHTSYKVIEAALEAQVRVIQAENSAVLSSTQDNLDEKKKDFSNLINARKITDEQIEEFWEILQLQIWLTKVEKVEQPSTVDSEEFFDAVENQANESEEAAKYKKEQEEWQNFLHELKEKLTRLS